MNLGATSRIIGSSLALDGREPRLLLLGGYRVPLATHRLQASEPPFRLIVTSRSAGFARRPAAGLPDDADRWRNVARRGDT
jgi:hypothetical protein